MPTDWKIYAKLSIRPTRSKFTSIATHVTNHIHARIRSPPSISGLNIILFPTVIICFRYFGIRNNSLILRELY